MRSIGRKWPFALAYPMIPRAARPARGGMPERRGIQPVIGRIFHLATIYYAEQIVSFKFSIYKK